MFIIDFDDTLFNTRPGFRDARAAALAHLGVSDELYQKTYYEARNSHDGQVWYNNRRHAQALALHGFDEEQVFKAFESTTTPEQIRKFLMPDAIIFLERLKKFGEPMVLLSLGEAEFQFVKVRALGIEKYFDRIFMVDKTKIEILAELLANVSDKQIWFINDKVPETKEVVERFPELIMVMKKSPPFSEEDYKKLGLPYFKTLTEIYEYIEKHR